MSAAAEGRKGPVRYLSRTLALVVLALFVALLAYGLLSRSADRTIDSSLGGKSAR